MEDLNNMKVNLSEGKIFLDLSEGEEEWAEVSMEVPEESSPDKEYHNYTVRVKKEDIMSALSGDTFAAFWKNVEKKVLEDINKEV